MSICYRRRITVCDVKQLRVQIKGQIDSGDGASNRVFRILKHAPHTFLRSDVPEFSAEGGHFGAFID